MIVMINSDSDDNSDSYSDDDDEIVIVIVVDGSQHTNTGFGAMEGCQALHFLNPHMAWHNSSVMLP